MCRKTLEGKTLAERKTLVAIFKGDNSASVQNRSDTSNFHKRVLLCFQRLLERPRELSRDAGAGRSVFRGAQRRIPDVQYLLPK